MNAALTPPPVAPVYGLRCHHTGSIVGHFDTRDQAEEIVAALEGWEVVER